MINPPELCAYGTGTLMVAKNLQRPEFGDPNFVQTLRQLEQRHSHKSHGDYQLNRGDRTFGYGLFTYRGSLQ